MINVVFLLLIFFLISAQIVTPPPVKVTPPTAEGTSVDTKLQLHVAADGDLVFDNVRGDAVWTALAEFADPETSALLVRADAALPASELARILARAATAGFTSVQLATVRP